MSARTWWQAPRAHRPLTAAETVDVWKEAFRNWQCGAHALDVAKLRDLLASTGNPPDAVEDCGESGVVFTYRDFKPAERASGVLRLTRPGSSEPRPGDGMWHVAVLGGP